MYHQRMHMIGGVADSLHSGLLDVFTTGIRSTRIAIVASHSESCFDARFAGFNVTMLVSMVQVLMMVFDVCLSCSSDVHTMFPTATPL
jgi:hypothetical protein